MAIEFNCSQCNKQLRVGEANAGKKAKCPKCDNICLIPEMTTAFDVLPDFSVPQADPIRPVKKSSPAQPAQQPAQKKQPVQKAKQKPKQTPAARIVKPARSKSTEKYFVATDFGQTYGPVTHADLVNWVAEGRITSGYVIRKESQKTGVYASKLFPELGPVSTPVVGVDGGKGQKLQPVKYVPEPVESNDPPIRATKLVDPSNVIGYAWEVCKPNFGVLFCGALLVSLPGAALNIWFEFFGDPESHQSVMIFLGCLPFCTLLATFFTIGFTQFCLKLARKQDCSFGQLFKGGGRIIPYILVSTFFGFAVALGTVLLLVPGLAVFVFFWPASMLVIDKKAGVLDAFPTAFAIGKLNYLATLVLIAATGGLIFLGILGCGIGLILVAPYIWMMWTVAYLMMTGQIPEKYQKVKIARHHGV